MSLSFCFSLFCFQFKFTYNLTANVFVRAIFVYNFVPNALPSIVLVNYIECINECTKEANESEEMVDENEQGKISTLFPYKSRFFAGLAGFPNPNSHFLRLGARLRGENPFLKKYKLRLDNFYDGSELTSRSGGKMIFRLRNVEP